MGCRRITAAWIAPARALQPADQVIYVDASIQGGQTHQLTKGDFITIPASIPHWFKDVPSSGITYYMVKVVKP